MGPEHVGNQLQTIRRFSLNTVHFVGFNFCGGVESLGFTKDEGFFEWIITYCLKTGSVQLVNADCMSVLRQLRVSASIYLYAD